MIRGTAPALLLCLTVVASADVQYWLDDVPDYYWHGGCSPTSGGMLIGYWDNQPGYENLYDGTAPMFAGTSTDAIDAIIASPEHLSNSYVRNECTHDNSPPPGDTGPNSIACFMHTDSGGGSSAWNIATGLRRYAAYDDPDTEIDESYDFTALLNYTARADWPDGFNGGAFAFEDLQQEIDNGRPVCLGLSLEGGGHSVVAYGYWVDDTGTEWYAVRDTWQNNSSNGYHGVIATMDSGQEWWSWELRESEEAFGGAYFVDSGRYFIPDTGGPLTETTDYGDTVESGETLNNFVDTIYASLDANDYDCYRIWLDQGDRIVAMTQDDEGFNEAINTVLALYDPDDEGIIYSDDFWPGVDGTKTSYLMWQADQSGWWKLVVSGSTPAVSGDYVLAYERDPIPEPATLGLFALGLAGLTVRRRLAAARRTGGGQGSLSRRRRRRPQAPVGRG